MNIGQGFFFYGIGDTEWFQGLILKKKFKESSMKLFLKFSSVTLFKPQKCSFDTIFCFLQEEEFKGMHLGHCMLSV